MKKVVSDQLRDAIREAAVSRYRIGKETGVEQSALSRFVNGTRGLSNWPKVRALKGVV